MSPTQSTTPERRRFVDRLRGIEPWAEPSSDLLDDVLAAYGPADLETVWAIVLRYAQAHDDDIHELLDRQADDSRSLPVLSDPALVLVLERLENDRYALRRAWAPHHDPVELRRLASLWGIRLDI